MEYGIGIWQETLLRLNEKTDLKLRLGRAFGEITVFKTEDACPEHCIQRDELFNKYLETAELAIVSSGEFETNEIQLKGVEAELRALCLEIIKYNKSHKENI